MRRVVVPPVDHPLQLQVVLLRRFRRALDVRLAAADAPVAGRHVLQDQQAELVAPVIPPIRLHLDVLARHVEAELFGDLNIVFERLVGGGGVDAVGPEALVERPAQEDRLAVEQDARHALLVRLADLDLAHAEIAVHGVGLLAVLAQLDVEVVEERLLRRPQVRLVDRQHERQVGSARRPWRRRWSPSFAVTAAVRPSLAPRSPQLDADLAVIDVGNDLQAVDAVLRPPAPARRSARCRWSACRRCRRA